MAQLYATPALLPAGPTNTSFLAGVQDANNHLAIAMTKFTQTPSGILVAEPADALGYPYAKAAPSSALYAGTVTLSTTAAQLPSQAGSEVLLQSDPSNTVNIGLGATSTSQPIILVPGQSMTLSVANLDLLYAVASSGTPVLNWMVRS